MTHIVPGCLHRQVLLVQGTGSLKKDKLGQRKAGCNHVRNKKDLEMAADWAQQLRPHMDIQLLVMTA